jgi:alkylation response protein AidB-like acyl-CoA dehydrogenase
MLDWTPQQRQVRQMFRKFCEAEVAPHLDALDTGEMLPYPILRKLFQSFGIGQMALGDFKAQLAREDIAPRGVEPTPASARPAEDRQEVGLALDPGEAASLRVLPVIELCRYVPGMVTALGVSVGLTPNAILSRGSRAQKERFVPDLLTLKKIGAWAITEPGAGSDAFGSMRATARQEGDGFVLSGQKTFITNGPYADTIVFFCKLDRGEPEAERPVISFILDGDTPGLTRTKAFRKMGMHCSPTGELFLDEVRVGMDRLMGENLERAIAAREAAKETFTQERTGVAAMALGIVERCTELSTEYARTRVQFGRPIGDFQLIQLKLAKMEVARQNIRNILFRQIEQMSAGQRPSLAEASANKLYCAQAAMDVCLEAVQLHGGYGYMADYRVEQLCRDAKVLQIYGGTDEIQVSQIARDLLGTR